MRPTYLLLFCLAISCSPHKTEPTPSPAPPTPAPAPTPAPPTPAPPTPPELAYTKAGDFPTPVKVVANRSSVMLYLPDVGAKDYRVFALTDGVRTNIVGDTEEVLGAVVTCAGLRQRNDCDDTEAVKAYGNIEIMFTANCSDDVRSINITKSVATQVEVNGISGPTKLVVEAIDQLCPFPGTIGNAHEDVPIAGADKPLTTTYKGKQITFPVYKLTFPIRTEAEVLADYGSLILNGHNPALPPDPLLGPYLNVAQPASKNAPRVLNRSFITVTPSGTAQRPAGYKDTDIFDDFTVDDPFVLLEARKDVEGVILPQGLGNVQNAKHYANSRWNQYTFNAEASQMFVSRGEMHSVLADIGQDVMSSNLLYPKRTMQVPDTGDLFLHVTFEIQANSTQRRYWWLHLCGSDQPGKTFSGSTFPGTSTILATPFFMNPGEGSQISMAGWNCLQFVPRAGSFDVLPGGEFENPTLGGSRSQSSLRILTNRATPAGQDPLKDNKSVILLDPSFITGDTPASNGQWVRTWDDKHIINGVLFDDQLLAAQRTTFDVYVNKSKVVVYINGKQKACDNFPTHKLTMAEAAVGLGHVFYHSSAERTELMEAQWIKTGQHFFFHNSPFVDVRSMDNVGMREGVNLPASFNNARCFDTP